MATRFLNLVAVLTGTLLVVSGCGARSPQRLANRAAVDKSGRVSLAKPENPSHAPAQLQGNIAQVSHAPQHLEPAVVTKANFEELVLNSQVPVMVDCWAPWCGPCQKMLPVVHDLAGEFEGRAVVAKLDIEAHPEVAARYGVTNIPAFLIFRDGELVDSVVGAVPKRHLERRLGAFSQNVQPVSGEVP